MLSVDRLTVQLGPTRALDEVTFDVPDGQVACVLGPSGCGKTTLLRTIAGLTAPTSGRVDWDGEDLAGVPPHRRRFGLMFQDHALFPHRDVLANVAFGLRMLRLSREDVQARARAALARVELTGFEQRRIADLSGGERQRVALARSLAPEPRLLMLDEPLGSLDRELRDTLVADLRDLFVRLSISTLVVTHDHDEAFALADRVVVLRSGRVEQAGPASDVWRHPQNAFVARFLGWNVTRVFGSLAAVRPEHVLLDDDASHRGRVTRSTFRRDRYVTTVDVDGESVEVALPVDQEPPKVGEAVGVGVRPGAIVTLPD